MRPDFQLAWDAFGRLDLTLADGTRHTDVRVVRAFPISAPDEGISIVNTENREMVWVSHIDELDPQQRTHVLDALQQREFMPEILRLESVNSYATPSTWEVQTNRGHATLVLKGEEDIRRLNANTLIVADAHGVQYLIRHLPSLDRQTRKMLDRFM